MDYFKAKSSLRSFFKAKTVATFVALFLIVATSLISLRQAILLSNSIVDKTLNEIHESMTLRLALNRSAMPVNDYVIRAVEEEKKRYFVLQAEVDKQFKLVATMVASEPALRATLGESHALWHEAIEIANIILEIPNPIGDSFAAAEMERFDAKVDSATNALNVLYESIYQDTKQNSGKLHEIEYRARFMILGLAAVGLLITLLGSFYLARMFFPPLNRVLAGVRLFGKGRLDHRIDHEMPVELDDLSNGINHMAERLDDIYSALRDSSYKDPLIGCFNRRKLDEDMLRAFSQAQRTGDHFSILMLDLDHFKSVNDTYGHPAGDAVLLSIAQVINSQLRKHELLYRFGGEEFIVLLPATIVAGAVVLAERIRMNIANKKMDVGTNKPIRVTVSIGITDNSQKDQGIKDLLESADHALYLAKEQGRNRVIVVN